MSIQGILRFWWCGVLLGSLALVFVAINNPIYCTQAWWCFMFITSVMLVMSGGIKFAMGIK